MALEAPAISCRHLHLLCRIGRLCQCHMPILKSYFWRRPQKGQTCSSVKTYALCGSICWLITDLCARFQSHLQLVACTQWNHLPSGVGHLRINTPTKHSWWRLSAHHWMWFAELHPQHMLLDLEFCFSFHIWLNIPGSDLILSLRSNITQWLTFPGPDYLCSSSCSVIFLCDKRAS